MIVPRTSGKLNIQENMEETYFFENGLRKVNPYDFTYRTYAKRRWVDKTIENVFTLEFHDRSPAYYVHKAKIIYFLNLGMGSSEW